MTISRELFLAILSMDSYNRGYGAGIADGGKDDPDGLGETKGSSRVGSAVVSYTIDDADLTDGAQSSGFYAIAYTVGAGVDGIAPGTTVIAYRGTDKLWELADLNPSSDAPGGDIWNSYAQGAGLSLTRAAHLAAGAGGQAGQAVCAGLCAR